MCARSAVWLSATACDPCRCVSLCASLCFFLAISATLHFRTECLAGSRWIMIPIVVQCRAVHKTLMWWIQRPSASATAQMAHICWFLFAKAWIRVAAQYMWDTWEATSTRVLGWIQCYGIKESPSWAYMRCCPACINLNIMRCPQLYTCWRTYAKLIWIF